MQIKLKDLQVADAIIIGFLVGAHEWINTARWTVALKKKVEEYWVRKYVGGDSMWHREINMVIKIQYCNTSTGGGSRRKERKARETSGRTNKLRSKHPTSKWRRNRSGLRRRPSARPSGQMRYRNSPTAGSNSSRP